MLIARAIQVQLTCTRLTAIDDRLQNEGRPFSMLIPGNRLHVVSSKEHGEEPNRSSLNHLSSHAWSKQHFQPMHTFGYEWPDRRGDDGMPVVRAIRTMTKRFSTLKPKFIRMMEEELGAALARSPVVHGA